MLVLPLIGILRVLTLFKIRKEGIGLVSWLNVRLFASPCFSLTYCDSDYYKSVLVLVHEDDASKTLFSRAGVYFALQKLSQLGSSSPTPDDRKLAELVMKYLSSSDRKTPNIMADIAVKWKDLALWTAVIEKSDLLISTFRTESFLEARKTFSFEDIRPT